MSTQIAYPFVETFDILNQTPEFDLYKAGCVNDFNCQMQWIPAPLAWMPEDAFETDDDHNMDAIEYEIDNCMIHNMYHEEQMELAQHQDPYNNEYTICIEDTKGYNIEYIKQNIEIFGNLICTQTRHYTFGGPKIALIITLDGLHHNGWADLLLNAFINKTPIDYVIDPNHNYDIEEITTDNYHQVIRITPLHY